MEWIFLSSARWNEALWLHTELVKESLTLCFCHLISQELKWSALGQCISQAFASIPCWTKHRNILLNIEKYRKPKHSLKIERFSSTRWLVDHLVKFGFSIIYDELKFSSSLQSPVMVWSQFRNMLFYKFNMSAIQYSNF